jgi:hypothetical protein
MSRKKTGYEGAAEQGEAALAEHLARVAELPPEIGSPQANGEKTDVVPGPGRSRENPPRYWLCKSMESAKFPIPVLICNSHRSAVKKAEELKALLTGMSIDVVILRVKRA